MVPCGSDAKVGEPKRRTVGSDAWLAQPPTTPAVTFDGFHHLGRVDRRSPRAAVSIGNGHCRTATTVVIPAVVDRVTWFGAHRNAHRRIENVTGGRSTSGAARVR